jgi:dihydrofolate synthase/folylpolyglutamate synthase
MAALVERLGHPEQAFRSVHIAGTNGKGSVTAMVDAALRADGHRSARYTSPHLVELRERFVIDGRPVAEDRMIAAVADVRSAVNALLTDGGLHAHPTFFEVTTAVAFELFRRAGVEIAVLEVGLGGRLDATNVVNPVMTAITSIAFDHQQHLGSTLAEIASEKAGILKPGVPAVLGRLPAEALAAIDAVARVRGAPLHHAFDGVAVSRRPRTEAVSLRTPVRDYGETELGLAGGHQIDNAVVAVRMLELLDAGGIPVGRAAIRSALAHPSWPGRLDLRRLTDGREVLLDAAHNPAGAEALASYLRETSGPLPLVFAAMRDKDIEGMLRALLPVVSLLVVTRASNRRSADPGALCELAHRLAPDARVTTAGSPIEALGIAWTASPRIVVAGSVFLLGDVLKAGRRLVIPFEDGC